MNRRKHVLIVGAGASGLMAAAELSVSFNITLIECRDRIGGRIFSSDAEFPVTIEKGAEFVHGAAPLTHDLIRKSGATMQRVTGEFYTVRKGKQLENNADEKAWRSLMKKLNTIEADMTMQEFISTHFGNPADEPIRELVRSFAEGYDAADLKKVSAIALRDEWNNQDDDDQHRIEEGYSHLMRYLAGQLAANNGRILLSSTVADIGWGDSGITVSLADGKQIQGDLLIFTLPAGVVQSQKVTFTPSLTAHMDAYQDLGFGGVIKFFYAFTDAFWSDHIQRRYENLAFIFSDAEIPTWWTNSPGDPQILIGWLAGPKASGVGHKTQELHRMALRSLAYIMHTGEDEIERAIRSWHITDWLDDPFAHGAYAYATPKTIEAIKTLSSPAGGKIYFAGEAIYSGEAMGTVEAALDSAVKTAQKIRESVIGGR